MSPADPRLLSPRVTGTSAEELLDRAIRHQTYLLRYSAHEVAVLRRVLEREVLPDLRERIAGRMAGIEARGYDTGPVVTARLQALQAETEATLSAALNRIRGQLSADLGDLAVHESSVAAKHLNDAIPIDVGAVSVPAATLRTLVGGMTVRGAVLEDWFGRMATGVPARVVSELGLGIQEGQTIREMAKRIDPILDATTAGVEATVRTFVTGVSAQTREATFRENDDIVDGAVWVSTLDDRTCIICASRDREVYDIDEGPRPPAHPNCRCSVTPKIKDIAGLAKAAGIRVGELPQGTRAALGGPVAKATTFEAWLSKQPKWRQDDILGPARAKAFRSDGLSLSEMIDAITGRPLTLDELGIELD